jgi:hypothetical protein
LTYLGGIRKENNLRLKRREKEKGIGPGGGFQLETQNEAYLL